MDDSKIFESDTYAIPVFHHYLLAQVAHTGVLWVHRTMRAHHTEPCPMRSLRHHESDPAVSATVQTTSALTLRPWKRTASPGLSLGRDSQRVYTALPRAETR